MSYLFKSIDVHSPKLPLEDSGLFTFLYHEAKIKSKGFQPEKRWRKPRIITKFTPFLKGILDEHKSLAISCCQCKHA